MVASFALVGLLSLDFVGGGSLKFVDQVAEQVRRVVVCDCVEEYPKPVKVSGVDGKDLLYQWDKRTGGNALYAPVCACSSDEFSPIWRKLTPSTQDDRKPLYDAVFPDRTRELLEVRADGSVTVKRQSDAYVNLAELSHMAPKRDVTVDPFVSGLNVAVSAGQVQYDDLLKAAAFAVGANVVADKKTGKTTVVPNWERMRLRWWREAVAKSKSETNPFFAAKAVMCAEAVAAVPVSEIKKCLTVAGYVVTVPADASPGLSRAIRDTVKTVTDWDRLYPTKKEFGRTLADIISTVDMSKEAKADLYGSGHAALRMFLKDGRFVVF